MYISSRGWLAFFPRRKGLIGCYGRTNHHPQVIVRKLFKGLETTPLLHSAVYTTGPRMASRVTPTEIVPA
ncbi:hypothetical protein CPC08DRAFT_704188 [Agrocybe pediades]|nr:hypothetical protein CPC08DRAFT_704188 [Agrocybe pediades]